jgi:acyl-CoA reductase-like NAD-dependent aldehyde dehydrogenase
MSAAPVEARGTVQIPQGKSTFPPTTTTQMDRAVAVVRDHRDAWVQVSVRDRIALLETLRKDTLAVSERWVARACEAKGITPGSGGEGEEWLAGPFTTIRNLRLFEQTLRAIEKNGTPGIAGKVRSVGNGQIAAEVFPGEIWDKLFYAGFTGEIWMEPGVTEQNLRDNQAHIYRTKAAGGTIEGKVALVLGAGNVASIGPMDVLYKLFVEDQVCVLKMNPVNEYLGPFIAEAFQALVERGFLRIVYGGAAEGQYLCNHPDVDEIHITGSDKTHDAIVFGGGPDGARRKAAKKPLNTKRVTSELGNVSPMIIVPGPWSSADREFQGANIASSLCNNAGFNCNATRMLITHKAWDQRRPLLEEVRKVLEATPRRRAYYPGAEERWNIFVKEHPDAEQYGKARADGLPWTLVSDVDPHNPDDPCFQTEAFCGLFGETALEASSVVEFIDRAVDFCNDQMWGTLNASILIHPSSLKDKAVADALERAIAKLRYGSVVINHWPALAYAFVSTTWGAFPGHDIYDIQSGVGVVHNASLFDRPQKTVIRGPFRVFPKPPWFVTNRNTAEIGRKLTAFEADPSWLKVPGIVGATLKG